MTKSAWIPQPDVLLVDDEAALQIAVDILKIVQMNRNEAGGCLKMQLQVDCSRGFATLRLGPAAGSPRTVHQFDCKVLTAGTYTKP